MKNFGNNLISLSVRRPILITVVNLIIMLAGIAAIPVLDIRELPDIDRPVVTVRAELDGASPLTMDTEVTNKIENAISRISGVEDIVSSSEEDNMRVRIEFKPEVNLHEAASEVREAVSRVTRDLPSEVDDITVLQADADAQPIIQIAAFSNSITIEELAERIDTEIVPAILAIEGVAEVSVSGEQPKALHIKLEPAKMAANNIAIAEVIAAVNQAKFDVPAGNYKSAEQDIIVRAFATLVDPEQLKKIHIYNNIRLDDIAEVYFGPEEAESFSMFNGRMVIGLGIVRQSGANTINISKEVTALINKVNSSAKDYALVISTDDAEYIRGALTEVIITLVLAIIIVLILIAMFLQQWRAVFIPAVTIPISLIGTLATIWIFGFSINLLTLLALVLATGLIVDDAIVVIENIFRKREEGMAPITAAIVGTQEVFFAVIATTITLIAVFIPIAFVPGETGKLFREFALVLTVSVSISAFVAVSLCTMLSSKLNTTKTSLGLGANIYHKLNIFGKKTSNFYYQSLDAVINKKLTFMLIFCAIGCLGVIGFTYLEQQLVPKEDRGFIRILLTGPDGASLLYSNEQSQKVEQILYPYKDSGQIKDIYTTVGRWDKNRVDIIATLNHWSERDFSQAELAAKLDGKLKNIPGVQIRIIQENSLNLSGVGSGLKVALLGNSYERISEIADIFATDIKQSISYVQDIIIDYDTSQPELAFDIDREKANDLKISMNAISETLRALVDKHEIIDLNIDDQSVPIIIAAGKNTIKDPNRILSIHVKNQENKLIPLSAVVSIREQGVSSELDRYQQRRAIELDIGLPPGESLSATVNKIKLIADSTLPADIEMILLGEADKLNQSSYELTMIFAISIVVVFLVLAAQFESWGSAIVVIFTVPFGLAAAVFALLISGQTINLYSQIGLILLVGLMTKNSILLVEFMDQMRDRGLSVPEAIMQGVKVRFRPVIMTVLATILGSVPLILGSGAGSEARAAIGWVIFGGLGLSTIFTLYITPLAYSYIAPYLKPRIHAERALDIEIQNLEQSATKLKDPRK